MTQFPIIVNELDLDNGFCLKNPAIVQIPKLRKNLNYTPRS